METITRKGYRGAGKALDDAPTSEQAGSGTQDNAGNGQVSGEGIGTQAESRQARDKRNIKRLQMMSTGASFLIRK